MNILLVEPDYYTRYPPIGLLKISRYHKRRGDRVKLVRVRVDGLRKPRKRPDRAFVTSLFTWSWRPVWEAVRFYKESFPGTEVWLRTIADIPMIIMLKDKRYLAFKRSAKKPEGTFVRSAMKVGTIATVETSRRLN